MLERTVGRVFDRWTTWSSFYGEPRQGRAHQDPFGRPRSRGHDGVSRKLEQLRQQAAQARQEKITTELLDFIACRYAGEAAL
jgi:hypothetical protein